MLFGAIGFGDFTLEKGVGSKLVWSNLMARNSF
jgi:hypothetical protein